MLDIADEGAKVLHNRCVEVGEKYNIPIIAKSTFIENSGTLINNKIEGSTVKSIVKNDDLKYVHITSDTNYTIDKFNKIYNSFIENELNVKNLVNSSVDTINISFTISKSKFNRFAGLLEEIWPELNATYLDITRISVIGNGIMSNNSILNKTMTIIEQNKLEIISMEINEAKIAIIFKEIIPDEIIDKADDVDKKGDMKSLFEKARFMLKNLPDWMLPVGWKGNDTYNKYMSISRPDGTGSITGESANPNASR